MAKPRKNSILVIGILIVSLLLGCGAEYLSASKSGPDYEKVYLDASEFSQWEFEPKGGSEYYALANNSYFISDDIGGIPVDHIHLDLSVDQGDTTTKTLYFYGVKDGVEGEFVVPLERDGNAFSARLRADRVDSIRFYPTQRVRTTVSFEGMMLNDVVETGRFSVPGMLVIALVIATAALLILKLLKKTDMGWRMLGGMTAASCGGALGYFASRIFTAAAMFGKALPLIAAITLAAVYTVIILYISKADTFVKKVFYGILVVGIVFSFATGPLQIPDETTHYMRAYAMAEGSFRYDYDHEYPNDMRLLYDYFPGEFYNVIQSDDRGSIPSGIRGYLSAVAGGVQSERELHTSIQITLPYVLPAIAIAVFRLFGANALICLWAARLANAIMYAFAVRYAFRKAKKYEVPLLIALAAPITVSMAASLSYDALFLAAFAVFAGTLLSEKIAGRDMTALIISYAVMVLIKPIYIPMLLLLLIKDKKNVMWNRFAAMGAMLAAGLALWGISQGLAVLLRIGISDPVYPEGVDYFGQIAFILRNPVKYLLILAVDGYENSFYIDKWGLFGTLDVKANMTTVLAPVAAGICCIISGEKKKSARHTAVFSVITVMMYVLIVTAFYVVWSTLGSTSILGVQARYFVPVIFTLAAAVTSVIKQLEQKERALNISAYVLVLVAAAGAAEVFLKYYLM
ncbi:MAG: DUF2142 domain-containing protein [Oscillospiraceae bacterium]|nr:DUF2142 domain-containing protein [Oscillospiraceae bacterium]